jgi:hypothetical protein
MSDVISTDKLAVTCIASYLNSVIVTFTVISFKSVRSRISSALNALWLSFNLILGLTSKLSAEDGEYDSGKDLNSTTL